MVTKQDILEYVMNSPYNTNYTILNQLLSSIEGGGSGKPKYIFNKDIISVEGMMAVPIDKSYQFSNGDLIEIDFQSDTVLLYIIENNESLYAIDSNFSLTATISFDEHPETGVEYMVFTNFTSFNPEGDEGGFTPTGSITITSNGTTNVYDYETAIVDVPAGDLNSVLTTITISGPSGYHILPKNDYRTIYSDGTVGFNTQNIQFYDTPITLKIPKVETGKYYYLELYSSDGRIKSLTGASGTSYTNNNSNAYANVRGGDNLVLTMTDA